MLSTKLRNARRNAGVTQDQLAELLGINRATISKYESGAIEPTMSQIEKICKALGISAISLFNDGSHMTLQEIQQSMKFDDYLQAGGYEIVSDYEFEGETGKCLFIDRNRKKLFLVDPDKVSKLEDCIKAFTEFTISQVLSSGTEICDNDGWFKG